MHRSNPIRAASRTRKRRLHDGADFAAETDLAEDGRARSDCTILHARRHGGDHSQIGSRLVYAHAARDIDIHVVAKQVQTGALLQSQPVEARAAADRCRSPSCAHCRTCCWSRAPALQPVSDAILRCSTARPSPGLPIDRSARNSWDGLGTSRSPVLVISNTPSSFAAPNRFLNARTTRCA